jgi:hypothetical protein
VRAPACGVRAKYADRTMPAHWVWIQVAIVLFVAIGMIVAIVKLV